MITAYFESTNETKKLKAKTPKEVLVESKINPVTVIVVRNGLPIIESQQLNDKDKISIIPI